MVERAHTEDLLRRATADPEISFRSGQWEAIDQLVNRHGRMLVVQRTGWGKSMVYFVSTRLLRDAGSGPAVIVSPLLALMRNQIEAAERLGLRPATINSSNREEWGRIGQALRADEIDLLLISPERLANDGFVEDVLLPIAGRIALLVVDEAHCISDWGHDFRPDYRRIVQVVRQIPDNVAVLATTATANRRVVDDIRAQLGARLLIQRGPLVRETLKLQVLRMPGAATRLAWLADRMDELPGSGIIYTLTVRDCEKVASWLESRGIAAAAYHAGIENAARIELEQRLLANDLKCLVATTALGMGFDKPDLGFVIHYQTPSSVVLYYQQVGRAGRAIPEAFGVLMSGEEDDDINAHFRNRAFPPESYVEAILEALRSAENGMTVREIEVEVNLRRGQIEQVLKLLVVEERAPILREGNRWFATPTAWRMDRARIERLTGRREVEWAQMQDYLGSRTCYMEFLANALDDEHAGPCGRCAACVGTPLLSEAIDRRTLAAAQRFVRHSEYVLEPRRQWPQGAFPQYGWRGGNIPANLRAERGRVLSRYGETGWGTLVRRGKVSGTFANELVEAVVDLLQNRWPAAEGVEWVTCVPSLRHPELVPRFAASLAQALGVPYSAAIRKTRETQPQKNMENSVHQCRNLDGVFAVDRTAVLAGPVLLVDDVVDSGWTLSVAATLLREAGSGPVFPFALASASPE